MTGASRFLHGYEPSPSWLSPSTPTVWSYSKAESLSPSDYSQFDLLLTGNPIAHEHAFDSIKVFDEFAGFGFNRQLGKGGWASWVPLERRTRPSVWVMGRKGKGCSTIRKLKGAN